MPEHKHWTFTGNISNLVGWVKCVPKKVDLLPLANLSRQHKPYNTYGFSTVTCLHGLVVSIDASYARGPGFKSPPARPFLGVLFCFVY